MGSKKLMSELPMHVSSATIRNDMADLENVGLIENTHSSSGRVPSMKGYRYYLDHLIQPAVLNPMDVALCNNHLDAIIIRLTRLFHNLPIFFQT